MNDPIALDRYPRAMRRCFGDDLRGPAWDRVREARRTLLGTEGVPLSEEAVPETFRHLLAHASLLSTGEEGALMEFWEVMDPHTREQLMEALSPLVTELRDFGLGRDPASVKPRWNPEALVATESQEDRLRAAMAEAAASLKPSNAERDAMLDLARIHDLFVMEWDEGKWR
jgi:hypothetical protein